MMKGNRHHLYRSESKSTQLGFSYARHLKLRRTTHNLDQIPTNQADYISQLPDSIIHHILSFLTAGDAIKTSILSKRWRYVWAEVPVLNFDYVRFRPSDRHFDSLIKDALKLHRGSKVQKLRIKFNYRKSLTSRVDKWVRFAEERNVEELNLEFHGDKYQLPQSIYSNSSLRILTTRLCDFMPTEGFSWASLKVLSICGTKLSNDDIAKILLGSPKLEFLKLDHCKGDHKIIVSSSNLKALEVKSVNVLDYERRSAMEISGPNIRSLSLFGCMHRMVFKLINLPSLVEANLTFAYDRCDLLIQLLGELHSVQKLTIGTNCLKVLSTCDLKSFSISPLSKLTALILDTLLHQWDLRGIVNLLQISPDLEKLTINMNPPSYSYEKLDLFEFYSNYWESTKTYFKFDHLKSVEITGLQMCRGFYLNFFSSVVELLLKNATALVKMVIYEQSTNKVVSYAKCNSLPNLVEVRKLILSYPRASANAVVLFKTSFN